MRKMPSDKIQGGGGGWGGGWGWQIQIQEKPHYTFVLKVGGASCSGAGGTPRLTAYIHVYKIVVEPLNGSHHWGMKFGPL